MSPIRYVFARVILNSLGESNSRKAVLQRMHGHFLLFCSTAGKSPALLGFTKGFLNVPSRKHSPWAKCKGSDAMILMKWIQVLCVACQQRILDESHRQTLEAMHVGARTACDLTLVRFLTSVY